MDNSKVFIEGQRVAREALHYDDELVVRFRINYGGLLDFVRGDRQPAETVLVGSRPPSNDARWNRLKTLGIEPGIFDRSFYSGREKRVDAELTNAIRDALEDNPEPGTMALVAGDADYVPAPKRCLKGKWQVELCFWTRASCDVERMGGAKSVDLAKGFDQ